MKPITLKQFADKVSETMPLVHRELSKLQSENFYKSKLTIPQCIILDMLNLYKEPKMTDLSKCMNVTTAAITGIIDRLVRDHYVTRIRDDKDRRIVKVKLTDKGNTTLKNFTEQRRKIIIKIFGVLTQKERIDYLKMITKVQNRLNNEKACCSAITQAGKS